MNWRKYFLVFSFVAGLSLVGGSVAGAYVAGSSNYRLELDSLNFAGGVGDSASYQTDSTLGESATGESSSANYELSAGYQQAPVSAGGGGDDGGGGGGGGGPPSVYGCTDSAATNYNSQATIDDGSCTYPPPPAVPNVSNFAGAYGSLLNQILLTWVNPVYPELAVVRVVGSPTSIPATPNDGFLVYEGVGESAVQPLPTPGTTFYYTAFVRSTSGIYSSGAVTAVVVPSTEPPPEEEEEEEEEEEGEEIPGGEEVPGGEDGGEPGGEGGAPDPFAIFPETESADPLVRELSLGDFVFSQVGERPQLFQIGGRVRINGQKPFTVSIAYDRVPETLKIIGLTLIDPDDPGRSFSFLLRINADKTAYTATVGSLGRSGAYPMYISLVNYQDQTLKRLVGTLQVAGLGFLDTSPAGILVREAVPSLIVGSGVAAGLIQAAALSSNIGSFYDLYLLLLKLIGVVAGALGLRRKQAPWGVVYDAITKRPLDPAYVVVQAAGDEKGTAITDLDGRYGFLLPPGQYKMVANKTHYRFPSQKLAGRAADELYANLYHGEDFATTPGEIVNRNIPLDPVSFDWNEYAKDKRGFFVLHSRQRKWRARLFNGVHLFGLLFTLYNVAVAPNWLNLTIFALYALVALGGAWWRRRRHAVVVRRESSGLPLAFAVIKVFSPGVDQLIKTVVADELGRFFLLTPPGEYYFTVEEKLDDESYREVYRSEPRQFRHGIIENDIILP